MVLLPPGWNQVITIKVVNQVMENIYMVAVIEEVITTLR